MTELQQLSEKLNAKRTEVQTLFEAAGPDLKMSAEDVDSVQTLMKEVDDLAAQVTAQRELTDIDAKNREALKKSKDVVHPAPFADGKGDAEGPTQQKSLGELFVNSKAFTAYDNANSKGPVSVEAISLKTLFAESAGFAPQAIRTGQVILSAQQMPRIVDVIPSTETTQVAVVYMRETTFTNAAAETAEGGTYPEAALAYTEETESVRKIAVFLPVTDEQLADVPAMQDRLNNRLTLMLRQRLDLQIVAGNNTPPNLHGILNTSGIQTQARGTDVNVDAIFKALTKLRSVGFVEPNAVLMNPTDWQSIRLLRTADGLYIFGPPSDSGATSIWGLPVVQSTYVTLHTAIAADFAGYTEIAYKAGLEFEVSNSHSDFFAKGQLAIRAQLRCAFVVLRPDAICSVTGLN